MDDIPDQQAAAEQQAMQETAAAAAQQAAAQQATAAAAAAAAAAQPVTVAQVMAMMDQQQQQHAAVVLTLRMSYQAASQYSKLMPKPEKFDGSKGSDVDAWLYGIKKFMDVTNFTTDWDRIAVATAYLDGAARDWWRMLEDTVADRPTTWIDFKEKMIAAFQPINPEETARNQLANLRQIGTVKAYASAFRRISYKIPGLTDDDKKHKFIIGLKSEPQKEVRLRAPATFQAAIEMAERFEAVSYSVNRSSGYRAVNAAPFRNGGSNGPTMMELGAASVVSRPNQLRNPNQQRPNLPRRPS